MKPCHWILPGLLLSLVSPVLGAIVMLPGWVLWIARRTSQEGSGRIDGAPRG